MSKKIYSAGLVSQGFWFHETKQYIEFLNEGKTEAEIKKLSEEANIFAAVSASRANETFNGARRRANALDSEMYQLFPKLNIDNQKIVVLIAVLRLNDLFLEFLLEVYQEKLHKNIYKLTLTDYRSFFSEKQRLNEVVMSWKPYTYHRLASAYKKYLLEAGLIREEKGDDLITPKIIDDRVVQWLKENDRLDILKAIAGGY
ncbi:DUF1819 family protein [Enterococcus lemanii]|uniref:DUF1819 family protein n=1 Tax=Enterococcus lemanii TaxID=1159752 RepID=A0ABV9MQF3_9ENTE|nr:DUF1819 family protein [Enterococcus lemanii]MBM7709398.1 hypothetical protein [Enterococcus lemanii]